MRPAATPIRRCEQRNVSDAERAAGNEFGRRSLNLCQRNPPCLSSASFLGAAAARPLAPVFSCATVRFLACGAALRMNFIGGVRHHCFQGAKNCAPGGTQIGAVGKRDLSQNFLAAMRQPQQNIAAVRAAACPLQQPMSLQAVHQLHRAVMLDLQPFGKHSDGRLGCGRQPLDRKQGLILLRLNAHSPCSLLAQVLEPPNFVTEFRERSVVEFAVRACFQGRGNYIVRRCKTEGAADTASNGCAQRFNRLAARNERWNGFTPAKIVARGLQRLAE